MRIGWSVAACLLLAGCVSNANGDWEPRPVYSWKCEKTGIHGFVLDEAGDPIHGVLVQLKVHPNGDTGTAIDTDQAGAWEICDYFSQESTLTFDKSGYEPLLIELGDVEGNELVTTLLRTT